MKYDTLVVYANTYRNLLGVTKETPELISRIVTVDICIEMSHSSHCVGSCAVDTSRQHVARVSLTLAVALALISSLSLPHASAGLRRAASCLASYEEEICHQKTMCNAGGRDNGRLSLSAR